MTTQPPQYPASLRLGLFFDGTGNNAANAALDEVEPIERSGSHSTATTNVVKLSQLYAGPPGMVKAIYLEGIGTCAGQADSFSGSALGRGSTGVVARVEQALAAVREAMSTVGAGRPITIDLFGFSRGATAARHCANQLLRIPGVRVGFIGLFDTVAAIGGLANLGRVHSAVAPGVNLHLDPARFADVVHLVARDEQRKNFALAQVCSGHVEIELPGAHSDLGGGYFTQAREQLFIGPMQTLTVALGTKVEATSIYRDALRLRDKWLAQGWPPQCLSIITPPPTRLAGRDQPPQQQVYAALQLQRDVRGELSRVYLRVMHGLALARGVPLLPVPETEGYTVPHVLQPLCQRFLAGDYRTSPEEERVLRLAYIHVSAHWNPPQGLQGNAPRMGAKALYINAPAANGERLRYRY